MSDEIGTTDLLMGTSDIASLALQFIDPAVALIRFSPDGPNPVPCTQARSPQVSSIMENSSTKLMHEFSVGPNLPIDLPSRPCRGKLADLAMPRGQRGEQGRGPRKGRALGAAGLIREDA